MKSKSIRLSDRQLTGLETVAKAITKQTKITCDACAVVRLAVDEFLEGRARKASRKAAGAITAAK